MAGRPETPRATRGNNRRLELVRDELTPAWASLPTAALSEAIVALDGGGPVDLFLRPGAIDLTTCVADRAVWETVFVAARVAGLGHGARRRTTVERRSLQAALPADDETEVRIAANGAMTVGEVVLTPAREVIPEPPRPDAAGVLRQRLMLPRSATDIEIILRLDGPNVCVPDHVRERFSHRQVSSVSLFERDGDWFISGVRNGDPTLVLTGAVGVY